MEVAELTGETDGERKEANVLVAFEADEATTGMESDAGGGAKDREEEESDGLGWENENEFVLEAGLPKPAKDEKREGSLRCVRLQQKSRLVKQNAQQTSSVLLIVDFKDEAAAWARLGKARILVKVE